MRELFPSPAQNVDPLDRYTADERRPPPNRPWVLLSMVASTDGATALDGRSGQLGGDGDRLVFRAVRAVADIILVAAGTVRAERYGPPTAGEDVQHRRRQRGRAALPRLAIVSRRLDLEPEAHCFTAAEPTNRPWLITVDDADPERLALLAPVVDDIIFAGTGSVDVVEALIACRARGASVVLCEGGPTLNGQLVAAGVVDEVCVTVAPDLVGGTSARVASAGPEHRTPLALDRVLEHDGALFLRYYRAPPGRAQ
jgi:riboflavin-specific deaminase-like protein